MNILRSIGAVLAGFITVAALSNGTDFALERPEWLKVPFYANAWWVIALVLAYRSVYATAGGYVAATLAPRRPVRHAMILGAIGLTVTVLGSVEMWDQSPVWFSVLLILLVLPCAWLGGTLAARRLQSRTRKTSGDFAAT